MSWLNRSKSPLCNAAWAGDQPEPIRCQLPVGHPQWPNSFGYHVGFTSEGVLVRFPEESLAEAVDRTNMENDE